VNALTRTAWAPGVVAAVAALLCGSPAAQAAPETRFVLARVVDGDGAPVIGLAPDEFIVREDGAAREIVNVLPARYPLAVLVDTSSFARPVFLQLRGAVVSFLDALTGRETALYTFGDQALRVVDFTTSVSALQQRASALFAEPEGQTHLADAIIRAADELKARRSPIVRILVLSAGGIDRSSRMPRTVYGAVLSSRAIVSAIEMRLSNAAPPASRPGRNDPAVDSSMVTFAGDRLLRGLADRTLGHYEHIFSGSGFAEAASGVRRQLESEVVIEYAIPAGAPAAHGLEIGTHLPGTTVRGIGLDWAPR
jgi:VWFA-related protein